MRHKTLNNKVQGIDGEVVKILQSTTSDRFLIGSPLSTVIGTAGRPRPTALWAGGVALQPIPVRSMGRPPR